MIGEDVEVSKEAKGETLSGGRALPIRPPVVKGRLEVAGAANGGNRMPPSGATVGENSAPFEDVCSNRKVRICGSDGLWGGALGRSGPELLESGGVIMSGRVLGFFFGILGGTMNAGVGGAENALVAVCGGCESPNLESWGPVRFVAEVFTDRFFMLRIFLFGESARSTPGKMGNELEKGSLRSISDWLCGTELVLEVLNDLRGEEESGVSGGERGEGSVREDSTVDIVVVGEDSVDSKVEVESRRTVGGAGWAMFMGLLYVLPCEAVAAASPSYASNLSGPFPNTDINEGKDVRSDCELVDTGILEPSDFVGEHLFADGYCSQDPYATSRPSDPLEGKTLLLRLV